MTNDVLERGQASQIPSFDDLVAKSSEFPTEIPEWVPTIIAKDARDSFGDFRRRAGADAILVRLTTDPRMQAVWAHLTRRRRLDGLFLQPTRFGLENMVDPVKRQEFALLMLFCSVRGIAENRPQTLLRRDAERIQQERGALARKLWGEADILAYLEEVGQSSPGRARVLNDAACVIWQLSRDGQAGDIVVDRDRGERDVQAVAMAIAGACTWLFGAPLYALTATLTAVALDCNVTPRKVREWGPILPSADKGSFFGLLSAVCKPEI